MKIKMNIDNFKNKFNNCKNKFNNYKKKFNNYKKKFSLGVLLIKLLITIVIYYFIKLLLVDLPLFVLFPPLLSFSIYFFVDFFSSVAFWFIS